MAAKRPMMATTIMISTRVKPAGRGFFVCFMLLLSGSRGVGYATAGLNDDVCPLILAVATAMAS
jgi:hypothetical protein